MGTGSPRFGFHGARVVSERGAPLRTFGTPLEATAATEKVGTCFGHFSQPGSECVFFFRICGEW